MGQTWRDLLFAHWRVPPSELDAHIPEGLEVELHDGSAWLGITPFRLEALRLRGLPPLPGVSSFFEVNVRAYVRAGDGKPGIWFFSLDASSRLAVEAARRSYKLPYFQARISMHHRGEEIDYQSRRIGDDRRVFSGRYSPEGATFNADPESLDGSSPNVTATTEATSAADSFELTSTTSRGYSNPRTHGSNALPSRPWSCTTNRSAISHADKMWSSGRSSVCLTEEHSQ
jgi:uncharacterized protein YqjF (DUF2071 family)